jgi:UDPglucose--hexose-1-phosphate uridylyltransferase
MSSGEHGEGISHSRFLSALGLSDMIDAGNRYKAEGLSGSHLRYEIASGLWSLHSPGKFSPRPKGYSFNNAGKQRTHERPNIQVERNPFDLANVHMTPPVLDSLPDPRDPSKLQTRCFENKFPVLSRPERPGQDEVQVSFVDSLFPQVSASGIHEVVVQHWRYNVCQALMTPDEVRTLWKALKRRFDYLSDVSRFVQLLENHGIRSGGSLPHPHSQLLGLPVVPGEQTRRYKVALEHWRERGECVFGAVLKSIVGSAGAGGKVDRMLTQNEHFVAFVPHAQERADEMWIMPKRQCHSFAEATPAEVDALALICRSCLRMLYLCHDDPDYNIMMRTSPTSKTDQPGDATTEPMALWYRWHLVIIPHDNHWAWGGIKGYGGFTEIQGMPEQHAMQLRSYEGMGLTGDSDEESPGEHGHPPPPLAAATAATAEVTALFTQAGFGGIKFKPCDGADGACVATIASGSQAEEHPQIQLGMVLVAIEARGESVNVDGTPYKDVISRLRSMPPAPDQPIKLSFKPGDDDDDAADDYDTAEEGEPPAAAANAAGNRTSSDGSPHKRMLKRHATVKSMFLTDAGLNHLVAAAVPDGQRHWCVVLEAL